MVYSPKEVGCAMCDDPNVPVVNVLVRDQEAQRLAIMVKGVIFCYGASAAQQERFMRILARSPGNAISYARSLLRDLEEEAKLRKAQEEKCPKR